MSDDGAKNWAAKLLDSLKNGFGAIALSAALSVPGFFLWQFLGPFSIWSWLTLLYWIAVYLSLVRLKYYRIAACALVVPFSLVPILSLSAGYYIASDQLRFRYGQVGGTSYLEFPASVRLFKKIALSEKGDRLITVAQCGDKKIAELQPLPYMPVYPQKDVLDAPFAFRRLPALKFQQLVLRVEAWTGSGIVQGKKQSSIGVQVAFPSFSPATIPITQIFPRSLACIEDTGGIPLLPIIELLPWDPNNTAALVKAAVRVNQLRGTYPNGIVSLDTLLKMRLENDDGEYKTLLEFLRYSVAYQVFAGNGFADTRADIASRVCVLMRSRSDVFVGPFSSLPENFLRVLILDMGPNYKFVAQACQVPDNIVRNYGQSAGATEQLPFVKTFSECVRSTSKVEKCLARDDAMPAAICKNQRCDMPIQHSSPEEALFEFYDQTFSDFVVNGTQSLLKIDTLKPGRCPILRDKQEDEQFVNWWIGHANAITAQPAQCSNPEWRAKYSESEKEAEDALSCAEKRGLAELWESRNLPTLRDELFGMKCTGAVAVKGDAVIKAISGFFDHLNETVDELNRYAPLIGHRRIDAIASAFEMFGKIEQAACGTRSIEACADDYTVWHDYRYLTNVGKTLNVSAFNGDQTEIILNLASMHNIIVDMAICDLLQDKELSQRTGYGRDAYCDAHGLQTYRMVGSEKLGRSFERINSFAKDGRSYFYESNGPNSEIGIEVPTGN